MDITGSLVMEWFCWLHIGALRSCLLFRLSKAIPYTHIHSISKAGRPPKPMIIGERKTAKQKQKWTREEEEALSAGVSKYGQGKWKLILNDPQFAPLFVNRSNIDLKDKWRNMTVSALGSTSRERLRNPILGLDLTMEGGPSAVLEGVDFNLTESGVGSSNTNRVGTVLGLDLNLPVCSPEPSPMLPHFAYGGTPETSPVLPLVAYGGTPEPSSVLPLVVYGGTPEPSRSTVDRREASDYEAMIFEALATIEDPIGLDVTAILNFIEERYELPQNYSRSLISKLRRLVLTGDLEEVGNRYRYNISRQVDAIPMNVENINEGENEENDRAGQEDAIPMNAENINDERNEEDGRLGQEDAIPMNVENINEGENEEDEIGGLTLEEVANVVARMISKSENMKQDAINACTNVGVLEEILEENMVMLKIAEDIHKRCKREGVVVLNI